MSDILPSENIRQRWGYMQKAEMDALHELISKLDKWSVCVNIGAGFGTSGLAFIESGNVHELYTIEKYQYMSENGLGSLEFEARTFREFGYLDDIRYNPIHGDSIEVGEAWETNFPIHMIFLDGDHSYEHCKRDIQVWLPHIKNGGVFAFHDYHEPMWPGVTQAIDEELTGKYKVIAQVANLIAFRIDQTALVGNDEW